MRFYTRDWYQRMQDIPLGFVSRADARAERLDEAFYQELYRVKSQERVEQDRSTYDLCLAEGIIPYWLRPRGGDPFEGPASETHNESGVFSPEDALARFDAGLRVTISEQCKRLPPDIYAQVADPRVLGLGVAAPAVLDMITEWRRQNQRYVEETVAAQCEYENQTCAGVPKDIVEGLDLHDAHVERVERKDDTLTLVMKEGYQSGGVISVSFVHCQRQSMEDPTRYWWLYSELEVLEDGRYGVNILLDGPGGLCEFELTASDICIHPVEDGLC